MPAPRDFDPAQLVELLRERGWTQRELARRSGHDENQISKYVNGHYPPNRESLFALADALGVPVDRLRRREGVPA